MTATSFKFDKRARAIIENFSRISPTLLFRPGNSLKTVSKDKDIFGIANIDVSIPDKFAIADLSKFLSVLGLYDEPDLTVDGEKTIVVSGSSGRKFKYTLAAEKAILSLREDWTKPVLKTVAQFKLPAAELLALKKAMAVGQLTEVVFEANGKALVAKGIRASDPTSDEYSNKVADHDKKFKLTFVDRKILNMMEFDYDVTVGTATDKEIPVVLFKTDGLEYFITPEIGSTLK